MASIESARTRRLWRLILLGCVAALLCGALFSSYQLLRAALILYTYPERPAPYVVRAYYRILGYSISRHDFTVAGTAGPIALRVYTPDGKKVPVPIVLVHGFAPRGNDDIHLNVLGRSLARAGFCVVIPTLPAAVQYEMKSSDLVVIEDAIRWSVTTYKRKVAVFGISFGGGLAIPAAANASVNKDVKVILALSGYNDLVRVGRYYVHEPVRDPNGRLYPDIGPNIGRIVIAAYMTEMLEPSDAQALRLPLEKLRLRPQQPLSKDDPSLRGLSTHDRELFEDVQVIRTPEMRNRFLGIFSRHHAEFEALSPSSVLPGIMTPTYILHGTRDEIFPPGEALWAKQELAHNPDAHVLITPSMVHVAIATPPGIREKLRVGLFFAGLLRDVSR